MPIATKISTLWIVVMFNMIFADILSFISPGFLAKAATGTIDGVTITPMFLLLAAVFAEVAIAMIYLSRALARPAARVANLLAVILTILFVVGGGALSPHYLFLAGIEVAALLYIAYLALNWRESATA